MALSLHRVAAATCLLACAPPALGWTPITRAHMTEQAVRFMPASLRLALETERRALLRGVLEPMTHEDDPAHRPPWTEGSLDEQVAAAAARLTEALEKPTRFDEVAASFGQLAHFVLDAGFPPGASRDGGDSRYEHFAAFCESRLSKFPLVFEGHEEPSLDRGDFRRFALASMVRADAEDQELARAYAAAGQPPNPAAFDDRSIPFAVASLSYSHAVNDVVRAWLAVWSQVGGDLGRTPYTAEAPQDSQDEDP